MPSRSAPNTRPASSTSTQSPGDSPPGPQRRSLTSRVLRRLRSLPQLIFRPSTPPYRSCRNRVPTPHPLDGIGGLSIASASNDAIHVGIRTPSTSPPGYPNRDYGHLATEQNTPVRLSSPTPRQQALNPTPEDLEQLQLALEEQQRQRQREAEAEAEAQAQAEAETTTAAAVDPTDLDGDTLVGPEEEAPSALEFDDELDGATLVDSDRDSLLELLHSAALAGGEAPPDPFEINWDLYFPPRAPPSIIPRVLRRVRRGLLRGIS